MNIFNLYLEKILKVINQAESSKILKLPENLESINVEIPPSHFDCDISTNVALILAKPNNMSPMEISTKIVQLIKNEDDYIDIINTAKPGFINIKFKNDFWNAFVKNILFNNKNYGINEKVKIKNYLFEFVSANPSGPLHVGHCRGAILGDVLSNLLLFNKHKVTKEYYVNDYGNQILSFVKSVYLRIKEIINNEPFPSNNNDLYPGDYLVKIAENILKNNKDLNFDNFENISSDLTKLSVNESLKIIKSNLNNLGVVHNNFINESVIVANNQVDKAVEKLKKNNLIYEGKIDAPKNEDSTKWIQREQLLFKSTNFGDDKDRALQKEDKTWTYFASDVGYDNSKFN